MNRIEYFKAFAKNLFSPLESEFHYTFEQEKIFRHGDMDWSIKHFYLNKAQNLRITIEQAPYYTDYGFTFSICNLTLNETVLIYNIAHESQDIANIFLSNAAKSIFRNQKAVDLISGKRWEQFPKVIIQK